MHVCAEDSVEVALEFFKACGAYLQDVNKHGFDRWAFCCISFSAEQPSSSPNSTFLFIHMLLNSIPIAMGMLMKHVLGHSPCIYMTALVNSHYFVVCSRTH